MMRIFVEGIGLAGPGLKGWSASQAVLTGVQPYVDTPLVLTPSVLLPPAERRRTGVPVKLSLAVGAEAFSHSGRDPLETQTVFTSSGGDGDNVHHLCESLASPDREVSPTRFHNSVHNAAAGYWSIATGSRAPSTSLCGFDGSFAMGLLEVALEVGASGVPTALIAYDHPYPAPLSGRRHIGPGFGTALIATADQGAQSIASLEIEFVGGTATTVPMTDAGLEQLRRETPAARALPLLVALATKSPAELTLDYTAFGHLAVKVTPC